MSIHTNYGAIPSVPEYQDWLRWVVLNLALPGWGEQSALLPGLRRGGLGACRRAQNTREG